MVLRYKFIILYLWLVCICRAQSANTDTLLGQANDFTYTLASGDQGNLYALQGEMLLLYFYDPTCEDCHALMNQLDTSAIVNEFLEKKQLIVLAIYPEEDTILWNAYNQHVPLKWINGYDKGAKINTEGIYFIKSIPTLYLLNKEKKILLKETTMKELEDKLRLINKEDI